MRDYCINTQPSHTSYLDWGYRWWTFCCFNRCSSNQLQFTTLCQEFYRTIEEVVHNKQALIILSILKSWQKWCMHEWPHCILPLKRQILNGEGLKMSYLMSKHSQQYNYWNNSNLCVQTVAFTRSRDLRVLLHCCASISWQAEIKDRDQG